MNQINKIAVVFLIYFSSCNNKQNGDVPVSSKIKDVTKEVIYSKFQEWLKSKNSFNEIILDTFNVILTDVNMDGYIDGLIDFNGFVPKDGNATWYMGYPYFENTDTGIKYIATLDGKMEDYPEINSINFVSNDNGVLKVYAVRYREGEPTCCPSIEREENYRLNGNKFDYVLKPNANWKFLDLDFVSSSCFEGEECIFEFKNEKGEILKFEWFLPMNSQPGTFELEFQNKFKYDGSAMGYTELNGKKVRVYYDQSVKNPGKCKTQEEGGLSCTQIKMIELL